MQKWMISASSKIYDHAAAFNSFGFIDWRQSLKYSVGDIVYIYCSSPEKKVKYKTIVEKINIPFADINYDEEFWVDKNAFKESQTGLYARLRLLLHIESDELGLDKLLKHGLKAAPQKGVKVAPELAAYLDQFMGENKELSFLTEEDIDEDIVLIKISKTYKPDMTPLELYEATRGIWKRKIESVKPANYCLSVYKGVVVEVFRIDNWFPAGSTEYKTRVIDESRVVGRIEFVGEIAKDNVRKKYIGKSVAKLYKNGEADPVKVLLCSLDINIARPPVDIIAINGIKKFICPNCDAEFIEAPRCPVCGQLIKNEVIN